MTSSPSVFPRSSPAGSSNGGDGGGIGGGRRLGFFANAMKRKESFVQLLLMSGIMMMSLRSLGQKYRIHDLSNDNAILREEGDALVLRMGSLKDSLLQEAAFSDPSGLLADRLRNLFRGSD